VLGRVCCEGIHQAVHIWYGLRFLLLFYFSRELGDCSAWLLQWSELFVRRFIGHYLSRQGHVKRYWWPSGSLIQIGSISVGWLREAFRRRGCAVSARRWVLFRVGSFFWISCIRRWDFWRFILRWLSASPGCGRGRIHPPWADPPKERRWGRFGVGITPPSRFSLLCYFRH